VARSLLIFFYHMGTGAVSGAGNMIDRFRIHLAMLKTDLLVLICSVADLDPVGSGRLGSDLDPGFSK
jgi:hypothetical protein